MDDFISVHIDKWLEDAGNKKLCLYFGKTSMFCDMESKITTREEVHDKVKVLTILEGKIHVDEERMFKLL